jgi:hypothetical protein
LLAKYRVSGFGYQIVHPDRISPSSWFAQPSISSVNSIWFVESMNEVISSCTNEFHPSTTPVMARSKEKTGSGFYRCPLARYFPDLPLAFVLPCPTSAVAA